MKMQTIQRMPKRKNISVTNYPMRRKKLE
uniref:Uncharacterized protein n=1 Tax=Rhizophora mucronata TaxID=61149 RepID=A0A2P2IK08_RHIMU